MTQRKKTKKGKKASNPRTLQHQKQSVVVNINTSHKGRSRGKNNAPARKPNNQIIQPYIQTLPIQMFSQYDMNTPNKMLPPPPPAPAVINHPLKSSIEPAVSTSNLPILSSISNGSMKTQILNDDDVSVLTLNDDDNFNDEEGINDRYTAPLDNNTPKNSTLTNLLNKIGLKRNKLLPVKKEIYEKTPPTIAQEKIKQEAAYDYDEIYPNQKSEITNKTNPDYNEEKSDDENLKRKLPYVDDNGDYHCTCGKKVQYKNRVKHFESQYHIRHG